MIKKIKPWWDKQAARIDALSLRERGIMFVSVIVLALALVDALLLSPAQLEHKQATQRFATQTTELNRLRDELRLTAVPVDASKAVRDEIAEAQAQIEQINQEIKAIAPLAEGGPALEQVLVQFLRRHEGLTLLGLSTLQPEVNAPAPATASTGTTAAVPVSAVSLTKRGIELRVSGPYAELARYVKTLENALPVLRWGALQLKSDKQPPELSMQVFVVGAQP
jgi:MSHA biogenesis protein MshJ